MGGFFDRILITVAVAATVSSCVSSPDPVTDGVATTGPDRDSSSSSAEHGGVVDDMGSSDSLLSVTDRKDGDSWVASDGREYRLGLVNAPERSQPCGSEALDFTYGFLADGFRADAYSTDQYGRLVAEVFSATGESLNVALAESGLGDDRYLEQFRHERPELGERLDAAFAGAPEPACRGGPVVTVAPVPLAPPVPSSTVTAPPPPPLSTTVAAAPVAPTAPSGCHPAYEPCVPVKGDGSGNGDANDLDCGQIGFRVSVAGLSDPYRLDSDGDGSGCESYGEGSGPPVGAGADVVSSPA